jgi:cysteine desulfurase
MHAIANQHTGQTPLYFDHMASTPVDPAVVEAMQPYFSEWCANPHAAEHMGGRTALRAIDDAREHVAFCIGCDAEDLIFTSGATESNNLAIIGAASAGSSDRDILLVSAIEHASVLEAARATGLLVRQVPVDACGRLIVDELAEMLCDRVKLVSVGAVNNEIGTIQDLTQIGERVQACGALFHVDAAQALTALSIRASELPIDFLSLSSHKAYGPKGIGALYIAPGRHRALRPLLHGGGQERGLRAGTLPTPLCVGFGTACKLVQQRGEDERHAVRARRDHLFAELKRRVPGVSLVGPSEGRHPGNLSVTFPVTDARDLVQAVQDQVACSTGSACHSGSELPSHVLLAIGLPVSEARRVIRLSIGRFTSFADCELASEALANAVDVATRVEDLDDIDRARSS